VKLLEEIKNSYEIKEDELPSEHKELFQKALISLEDTFYDYYNLIGRYFPEYKPPVSVKELIDNFRNKKKVSFPLPPSYSKLDYDVPPTTPQKVRQISKHIEKATQEFSRKERYCMEVFCENNCAFSFEPKGIEGYRETLNLPYAKSAEKVIKHYISTRSEACLAPTPMASRRLLLCNICSRGFLGKNEESIPSCHMNSKEIG
jgi:hypothetical protein